MIEEKVLKEEGVYFDFHLRLGNNADTPSTLWVGSAILPTAPQHSPVRRHLAQTTPTFRLSLWCGLVAPGAASGRWERAVSALAFMALGGGMALGHVLHHFPERPAGASTAISSRLRHLSQAACSETEAAASLGLRVPTVALGALHVYIGDSLFKWLANGLVEARVQEGSVSRSWCLGGCC